MEMASRRRRFNFDKRDGFVVGFHYFFDYVVCHSVSRIFGGAFPEFVTNKEFDKSVPIFFDLTLLSLGDSFVVYFVSRVKTSAK